MNRTETNIINVVLSSIEGTIPTREEMTHRVRTFTDAFGTLPGADPVDIDAVVRHLEESCSVHVPPAVAMVDDADHLEWLPQRDPDIAWDYWKRYRRWLSEDRLMPPAAVDQLEQITRRILGHLEDPTRPGPWDRRGLVVGQVQSGKTGNYAGLLCRAADAGYKVLVVLAGIHNSLRSQTQLRLDESFLGFDTQRRRYVNAAEVGVFTSISLGVGRQIGTSPLYPTSLTSSAENGDFLKKNADQVGRAVGNEPTLLVVKKHTGILNNLRDWLTSNAGTGEGRTIDLPLLVIDDEADNASINTAQPPAGVSKDDIDPSRVNAAIRQLLNTFNRSAYIGYTATPFANIFIERADHNEFGPDLFPRSFIEYLRPPTNYMGPSRLFGLADEDSPPLPLWRHVADHGTWLADRHRSGARPGKQLPVTLRQAIRAFVLTCAARRARGQRAAHNSMLVHVTRFQAVQQQVAGQLTDELGALRQAVLYGTGSLDPRPELRELWETDFIPTTTSMEEAPLPWSAVDEHLADAVSAIEVKTINGTSADALTYFEKRAEGANLIVIGGDKLSRGLTLEGLTITYYLRSANAYDTLLQMGRWFGYRPGFEDLCRLYTTPQLYTAYGEITNANEELVREFENMAIEGRTPQQYGLRVRNSANGLHITAANKRGAGRRLRIGFSGDSSETVALPCDTATADANLATTGRFIAQLAADRPPERRDSHQRGTAVFADVDGERVVEEFLEPFRTHTSAWRVNTGALAAYVRNRLTAGELTNWTVALISNRSGTPETIGGLDIGLTVRSLNTRTGRTKVDRDRVYPIRRILNPPDELIDIPPPHDRLRDETRLLAGERAVAADYIAGRVIRGHRDPHRGLLLIYPLQPVDKDDGVEPGVTGISDNPLIGFFISFPASHGAPTVEYTVNETYWDGLYGDDDTNRP